MFHPRDSERPDGEGGQTPMLMCRSCGHFVVADDSGDRKEPVPDDCPDCGGTAFRDPASD